MLLLSRYVHSNATITTRESYQKTQFHQFVDCRYVPIHNKQFSITKIILSSMIRVEDLNFTFYYYIQGVVHLHCSVKLQMTLVQQSFQNVFSVGVSKVNPLP